MSTTTKSAAGAESLKLRRCMLCGKIYQKSPTVYAVHRPNAENRTLECSNCGATVHYLSNGGGSSVSCWKCRFVNATGADESKSEDEKKGVKDKLLGLFRKKPAPAPTVQNPMGNLDDCPKEGLCNSCTIQEAGLQSTDLMTAQPPRPDAKDYNDQHQPPSPTSVEACFKALVTTEWSVRKGYQQEEKELWRRISEGLQAGPGAEVDLVFAREEHIESDDDECGGDDVDKTRLAQANTAIQSVTPDECELSPIRHTKIVKLPDGEHSSLEHHVATKDDESKDGGDVSLERLKVANTAVQSNTPEECELSPVRKAPRVGSLPEGEAGGASNETSDTARLMSVNTAIQPNTPEECELSPPRRVHRDVCNNIENETNGGKDEDGDTDDEKDGVEDKEEMKDDKEEMKEEMKDDKEEMKEEMKDDKEEMKEEMKNDKEEMKEEMKDAKEEMKEEMKDDKEEMKEEMKDDKEEMKEEMKDDKEEMKEEMKNDKEEMKEEMKNDKEEMKEEMKDAKEEMKEEMKDDKEGVKDDEEAKDQKEDDEEGERNDKEAKEAEVDDKEGEDDEAKGMEAAGAAASGAPKQGRGGGQGGGRRRRRRK